MANLANNHEEYLTPDAQFVPVEITRSILDATTGEGNIPGAGDGGIE